MQILDRVKALCAEAGVVVVLTPEFKGIHLSGATRWMLLAVLVAINVVLISVRDVFRRENRG